MFTGVRGRLSGWLAVLALWPVVGFGQIIIEPPQNVTVCFGEEAIFESETDGGHSGWKINGILAEDSPPDKGFIEQSPRVTSDATILLTLKFKPTTPFSRNGVKIESIVINPVNGSSEISSEAVYLFYKTNQQLPATGLNATTNNTAIQVSWDASEVRVQYLVSVTDITETPVVTRSPHYVYFPESQNCQWYEFMVTTHECFNATNSDTSQTTAASVRVAYPNISPVTAEFDNQTVLVSWPFDGGNTFRIVVTDLESGNQTAYNGTSPFSYMPARCGQFTLNFEVSPAQCAGEPGFTHSDSYPASPLPAQPLLLKPLKPRSPTSTPAHRLVTRQCCWRLPPSSPC